MSHGAVTQVFYVDGDDTATKVLVAQSPAVPRVGELVQLGPEGGPYEWRRVREVTWRHEPGVGGGTSVAILLQSTAEGHAVREGARRGAGASAPRPERSRRDDDDRQPRLIEE